MSYDLIKRLPEVAIDTLTHIFNKILSGEHTIPESWFNVLVCPILKPGKDPSSYSSYRPIALLSCFRKVFEHLLKNRLERWCTLNNIIPSCQFGFCRGLSTLDNLLHFQVDLLTALSRGQSVAAVFLDISGAYDNVLPELLISKLQQLGIPSKVAKCLYLLLSKKTISVKACPSNIGPRTSYIGLPQGSILSPIAFNVYSSDIMEVVAGDVQVLQYADDICLYVPNRNPVTSSIVLNRTQCSHWMARFAWTSTIYN